MSGQACIMANVFRIISFGYSIVIDDYFKNNTRVNCSLTAQINAKTTLKNEVLFKAVQKKIAKKGKQLLSIRKFV